MLICLTQLAYDKFSSIVRPGGLLLTDTRHVKTSRKSDARQVELPMHRTVMDKIGKPIVFNICVIGALLSLTDLMSPESIMKVLETRTPSAFLEMNREALDLGMEMGMTLKN